MPLKGYKQTQIHKRKLSESHKGLKHSEESKKKIRGRNNPAKRSSVRKKISQKLKGRKFSKQWRRKISESKKGNKVNLGRVFSKEHKRKLGEAHKGKKILIQFLYKWKRFGIKNPAWKGGLSYEPYSTDWTKILKLSIKQRDNFTCQLCKVTQEGKALSIHHINYNKKNCNPNNLISLCRSCHSKTNFNRNYWIKLFTKNEDDT